MNPANGTLDPGLCIGMLWLILQQPDPILKACLRCEGEGCKACDDGWVRTGDSEILLDSLLLSRGSWS